MDAKVKMIYKLRYVLTQYGRFSGFCLVSKIADRDILMQQLNNLLRKIRRY